MAGQYQHPKIKAKNSIFFQLKKILLLLFFILFYFVDGALQAAILSRTSELVLVVQWRDFSWLEIS